jgi:SAM-dependent methyltransferase
MTNEPIQHTITRYWDARGESYDSSVSHSLRDAAERDVWLRLLQSILPPAPARVLDVGTGTGFLAVLLAELGHRVVGVDLSTGMLAHAEAKGAGLTPAPVFQVGDAHDPPGDPGSFDVVISRHVLWTLREPTRALESWRRLLRPGGTLVVIDGLWWYGGVDPSATDATEPWHALWKTHYSAEVQAALPLMHAQSLAPAEELLRASGWVDVAAERLAAVEQLERERREDGGEPQPRFVLTAHRPVA